jgi:hypothetical protein
MNTDNLHTDNMPMGFGKYAAKTPIQVHDIDPKYLVWAYENVGTHVCTIALYKSAKFDIEDELDFQDEKERDNDLFDSYGRSN